MSSSNLNGLSLFLHTNQPQDDSDIEAELEVDQLDSDTDPDEPTKNSKAKNNSNRPGERVPGHTLLPAVRLQNILTADGITGNLAVSKEGLFVMSIATEEFIKRLIQAGHREASAHRRNQINYTDMATTPGQYQEFMCLSDTIPPPISLADALLLRQEKERELIEDNPALAAPFPAPSTIPSTIPTPEPEISNVRAPKPPKKSRTTNGKEKEKEKQNGSSSTTSKRSSKKSSKSHHQNTDSVIDDPMDVGYAMDSHNSRRSGRNGLSAASSIPPPHTNGQPSGISPSHSPGYYSPPTVSRENSIEHIPRPPLPRNPDSMSHTPPYDVSWPGQFTGPASGFLQGPTPPFGRASQNPGRTIYSQNHRPD